jgi:4'-phosphopantetheinyl transferase
MERSHREKTQWDFRRPPSSPFPFPVGRVDIWRVHLDLPALEGADSNLLSADELTRANRFHFEKDRIRFTMCRSALRSLLAGYLAIPASDVAFDYLASGKPQLATEQNPRAVQFNVSHSASMALIAISSGYQLGIDVEKIRDDVNATSLAERFFSLRERAALRVLPNHLLAAGFFACWTRKEAFLKATGTGLSFPLADFSVSAHPDRPQTGEINTEGGKQWFLSDIDVGEGYRAALATNSERPHVKAYDY